MFPVEYKMIFLNNICINFQNRVNDYTKNSHNLNVFKKFYGNNFAISCPTAQ